MALNDDILDAELRHAVGLQRLSTGLVKRIQSFLQAVEADIELQLREGLVRLDPETFRFSGIRLQRLRTLLSGIRGQYEAAAKELAKRADKDLTALARYEADYQARLLAGQIPVSVEVATPPVQLLTEVVRQRPFHGAILADWTAQVGAAAAARVARQVRIGLAAGEGVDQIVRRVVGTRANHYRDGVMEITRRQAEAVVRTAVNHVTTATREETFLRNDDLIKGVRWVSTLDSRTTPLCRALDGNIYPLDEGPRPPAHFNCRSTTTPVVRSWRELGIDRDDIAPGERASMNGQVPADLTYQEWLRRQSAEFQDDVLGPTRGALFRRGDLTLDRFVDQAGRQYTLDELRRRESEAFDKAGI